MNRRSLALGAVVLLMAGVVGYVALRDQDTDTTAAPRAERVRRDPKTTETDRPPSSAPVVASAGAPGAPAQGSGREYVVGGVRVRDHRSGDHAPVDVPPAVHPPGARKIASQLTSDLARQLRGAMAACTASVPAEARGTTPRVEGEIRIAIKDKQATITNATFQPRDITGNAVDAVKQCLQDKAIGVTTPSGDEPDLEGYAITLSLRVP